MRADFFLAGLSSALMTAFALIFGINRPSRTGVARERETADIAQCLHDARGRIDACPVGG
jgi:hypothetical protein